MIPLPPANSASLELFLKSIRAKSDRLRAEKSKYYGFDFAKERPLTGNTKITWKKLPEKSEPCHMRYKRIKLEESNVGIKESLNASSLDNDKDEKGGSANDNLKRFKEESQN